MSLWTMLLTPMLLLPVLSGRSSRRKNDVEYRGGHDRLESRGHCLMKTICLTLTSL